MPPISTSASAPARFSRSADATRRGSRARAAKLAGATPIVSCAANARARFDAIASSIARRYIDQSGASFGERLASTAEAAFALGFDDVLITGIDAPPVRVHEAFVALRHARA